MCVFVSVRESDIGAGAVITTLERRVALSPCKRRSGMSSDSTEPTLEKKKAVVELATYTGAD